MLSHTIDSQSIYSDPKPTRLPQKELSDIYQESELASFSFFLLFRDSNLIVTGQSWRELESAWIQKSLGKNNHHFESGLFRVQKYVCKVFHTLSSITTLGISWNMSKFNIGSSQKLSKNQMFYLLCLNSFYVLLNDSMGFVWFMLSFQSCVKN